MQKGINESLKAQVGSIRKKKDQEIMELQMQMQVLAINYDQLAAEAGRKGKKKMFTMADLEKTTQETEGKDGGTAAVLTTHADIGSGADTNSNSAADCDSDAYMDVDVDGDGEVKSDADLLLDFAAMFPLRTPRPIQANTAAEENHAKAQITLVEPYDPSLLD